MKRKILSAALFLLPFVFFAEAKGSDNPAARRNLALSERNTYRAMTLVDSTLVHCFADGAMFRFYNPFASLVPDEKASVWMYTSSIEAVNAVLHALQSHKKYGDARIHALYFKRYARLLGKLYADLEYYAGTFTLTSYTQTREWMVYGVDRGKEKGRARVEGIYNVYDDQQWLIRELLESYKLTGNKNYLRKAEYLTEYVLDGWDTTLNELATENGGITWGPGYTTKHACSNGPVISPLVWLHELYKNKKDKIARRYIASGGERMVRNEEKRDYYLKLAEAVYRWQKTNLLRGDGVFYDMMGGCDPDCHVGYETIDGQKYRKHTPLREAAGKPYTYNSGTMISGAADLYRATGEKIYLDDAERLSRCAFQYFAKPHPELTGYYSYPVEGFSNWFNGVLMRGFSDASPFFETAGEYLRTFQQNLDYGYVHFLQKGVLPTDLLMGWDGDEQKNRVESMFVFTFAAEYANLARYELERALNRDDAKKQK